MMRKKKPNTEPNCTDSEQRKAMISSAVQIHTMRATTMATMMTWNWISTRVSSKV